MVSQTAGYFWLLLICLIHFLVIKGSVFTVAFGGNISSSSISSSSSSSHSSRSICNSFFCGEGGGEEINIP